jgi:hypothetical protein
VVERLLSRDGVKKRLHAMQTGAHTSRGGKTAVGREETVEHRVPSGRQRMEGRCHSRRCERRCFKMVEREGGDRPGGAIRVIDRTRYADCRLVQQPHWSRSVAYRRRTHRRAWHPYAGTGLGKGTSSTACFSPTPVRPSLHHTHTTQPQPPAFMCSHAS